MEVNDIFTQIENFWDRISVPILFHIFFFLLFIFIFGKFSIKNLIEKYIQSESFNRTKAILVEFELWKKLPLIFIFLVLIYLTFFNSLVGLIGSVNFFPFHITYSKQEFLLEYEPKENIIEIAKYGKYTNPDLFRVDQLKESLLEEYKRKYPEMYNNWIKWTKEQFAERNRIFNLASITIFALFISLVIKLFQKNRTNKFRSFLKFFLVLIFVLPTLFLLRYREEQSIEYRFSNEILFVKSSLETDSSRQIPLDSMQLRELEKRLDMELRNRRVNQSRLWVSRIVGQSEVLQNILGSRKLRTSISKDEDYFE